MSADPIIACEDVAEIAARRIAHLVSAPHGSLQEGILHFKEIEEQAAVARIALQRVVDIERGAQ